MKIRPLSDRIIVRPEAPKDKTQGGLIIPDTAKDKPQRGIIIAAGGDVKVCKEGDEIIYGKYSGTEIEIDGTPYLIMRESDAFAIV